MSSYDKLLGALAVANSQKNLAGDLKDYNDILVHHLDKVYSHESLLKNKLNPSNLIRPFKNSFSYR